MFFFIKPLNCDMFSFGIIQIYKTSPQFELLNLFAISEYCVCMN